jgi:hypothetical protein
VIRICLEPWLSSCRAVEALSRLRRAAVEAVVEALPVEPCRACRVPVEAVEADSMRRRVELLSRAVKFLCRGTSHEAVELCLSVLSSSSSSMACSFAILHEAL